MSDLEQSKLYHPYVMCFFFFYRQGCGRAELKYIYYICCC